MEKRVIKTVTTVLRVELTSEEIEKILIEHFGFAYHARVDFDIYPTGGCVISQTEVASTE